MFSNFKRSVSLVLLVGVANIAFAAPAPVSDLTRSSTTNASSGSSETDVERLERLFNNRARVQLQMQQQIDDMTLELSELRGMVERNSYEMKQMLDRQRELFIELDKLRNTTQQVETSDTPTDDTVAASGIYTSNEGEEAAYKKAVYLVTVDKDLAGALTAFTQFQKDYPNSSFIPNSHYWIGQLNFAQKKDVEATKSFAAVIAYKDSNKRADSLVKLGDIAARNGKLDVAKQYYQQVITEYPNSSSAEMAEKKLN